jgi:hypothetical protein
VNLSNKLLKIEGEACRTRIVSSIHKVGDRYAFLDIGWAQDPAGNPFHYIGQMVSEKKDKWRFEDKSPNLPEPRSFVVTPITFADKHFGGSMLDDARKSWESNKSIRL